MDIGNKMREGAMEAEQDEGRKEGAAESGGRVQVLGRQGTYSRSSPKSKVLGKKPWRQSFSLDDDVMQ